MSNQVRVHLLISGRVQGVCFRMYLEQEAARRRITGWVRNLPTGQVEALCEGDPAGVKGVVEWCHQGPPAARVRSVTVEWQTPCGDLPDFRIL